MNREILYVQKNRDRARNLIKAHYENRCIFTGLHYLDILRSGQSLDCAHVYPAGKTKYIRIRNLPINMFPIVRYMHTGDSGTLDYVKWFREERNAWERKSYLVDHAHPDMRQRVCEQLELLDDRKEFYLAA